MGLAEELRADAKAAAHTLAGNGGTFGFHLVSELAREAEALLRDTAAATPESRHRGARPLRTRIGTSARAPSRTGRVAWPTPRETNRWRPDSTMWPSL